MVGVVIVADELAERCHQIGQWMAFLHCAGVEQGIESGDGGGVIVFAANRAQRYMLGERCEMFSQTGSGATVDHGFHFSYSLWVNTWRINTIFRLK